MPRARRGLNGDWGLALALLAPPGWRVKSLVLSLDRKTNDPIMGA